MTAAPPTGLRGRMRAVVHDRYGPPDVLRIEHVERPVPKDDEVLANRTDTGFRSAEFFVARFFTGLLRPRRKILGSEFAGEVEAVGAAVTEFTVGDRVFGVNAKGGAKARERHSASVRDPPGGGFCASGAEYAPWRDRASVPTAAINSKGLTCGTSSCSWHSWPCSSRPRSSSAGSRGAGAKPVGTPSGTLS